MDIVAQLLANKFTINDSKFMLIYNDSLPYATIYDRSVNDVGKINYVSNGRYVRYSGYITLDNIKYGFNSCNTLQIVLRPYSNKQGNRYNIKTLDYVKKRDKHYVEHVDKSLYQDSIRNSEANLLAKHGTKQMSYLPITDEFNRMLECIISYREHLHNDNRATLDNVFSFIMDNDMITYEYLMWIRKIYDKIMTE